MTYTFNKEKHRHFLDGKELTGCTTILRVLAKPALIQWAANTAVEYVRDHFPTFEEISSDSKAIDKVLEEARTAHCKRKEKAGEYGTQTHEEIEKMINYAIENNGGYIKETVDLINGSIINFGNWATKNKVKFLASEKNVYSEKMWLGGIVDFICEIDGQVWIGDIKTSKSGIFPENFWQCAGYDLMIKEMELPFANDIKGYLILNLKETGEILEKRSISNSENTKGFLACLDIYRIQEKIKNQIIN